MEEIVMNNFYNDDIKLLERYSLSIFLHENENHTCKCYDCDKWYVFKDGQQEVICTQCQKHICSKCCHDYHPGISCEKQREIEISKEKGEYELVWTDTEKECPYCHVAIQKKEGCQWLFCPMCKSYFCWICMQVTNDHAHRPGQVCKSYMKVITN